MDGVRGGGTSYVFCWSRKQKEYAEREGWIALCLGLWFWGPPVSARWVAPAPHMNFVIKVNMYKVILIRVQPKVFSWHIYLLKSRQQYCMSKIQSNKLLNKWFGENIPIKLLIPTIFNTFWLTLYGRELHNYKGVVLSHEVCILLELSK